MPSVRNLCEASLLLFSVAAAASGQSNYSLCDVNRDGAINIKDGQAMASQALGAAASANDLTSDGVVNIVDLQTEINAILFGCPFYSVTPRFAITTVSLVNQAWIPSDIPSPGNLAVHAAVGSPTSLVNQAWLPADIPSAGNLAVHAAVARPASLVNQAWIPADIPSPGNLSFHAAEAPPLSLVNQAWISADLPSPGKVKFVAGLLVSVTITPPRAARFPASRCECWAAVSPPRPSICPLCGMAMLCSPDRPYISAFIPRTMALWLPTFW